MKEFLSTWWLVFVSPLTILLIAAGFVFFYGYQAKASTQPDVPFNPGESAVLEPADGIVCVCFHKQEGE